MKASEHSVPLRVHLISPQEGQALQVREALRGPAEAPFWAIPVHVWRSQPRSLPPAGLQVLVGGRSSTAAADGVLELAADGEDLSASEVLGAIVVHLCRLHELDVAVALELPAALRARMELCLAGARFVAPRQAEVVVCDLVVDAHRAWTIAMPSAPRGLVADEYLPTGTPDDGLCTAVRRAALGRWWFRRVAAALAVEVPMLGAAEILARRPRAADLLRGGALGPGRAGVVLHPEPPAETRLRRLVRQERDGMVLATPSQAWAGLLGGGGPVPLGNRVVWFGMGSFTPDDGYDQEHVDEVVRQLAWGLSAAGARILYLGDARRGGFTDTLATTLAQLDPTADGAGSRLMWRPLDEDEPLPLDRLCERLPELSKSTERRKAAAEQADLLVVLGGRLHFKGSKPPGVLVEAIEALEAGTPVWVIGGFGGAARLVGAAMGGDQAYCDEWAQGLGDSEPAGRALLRRLSEAIRSLAPAEVLSTVQFDQLRRSTDTLQIVSGVVGGLVALRRADTRGSAAGSLEVKLYQGSLGELDWLDGIGVWAKAEPGQALPVMEVGQALGLAPRMGSMSVRADGVWVAADRAVGGMCWLGVQRVIDGDIIAATESLLTQFAHHGLTEVAIEVELPQDALDAFTCLSDVIKTVSGLGFRRITLGVGPRRDAVDRALRSQELRGVRIVTLPVPEDPRRRDLLSLREQAGELEVVWVPGVGVSGALVARVTSALRPIESFDREPSLSDAMKIGTELHQALPEVVQQVIDRPRSPELVLVHDAAAGALPHELTRVGDASLAMQRRITRRPLTTQALPPRGGLSRAGLKILLVLADLSKLDRLEAFRDRLLMQGFSADLVIAEDVSSLRDALQTPDVALLYYYGHARTEDGVGKFGVQGGVLPAAELRWDGQAPRIVILNGCESGNFGKIGLGLAPAFLAGGTQAYIGPYWRVESNRAATFGETLIETWLSGVTLGTAMYTARRALARQQESTHLHYLLYGDSELRLSR